MKRKIEDLETENENLTKRLKIAEEESKTTKKKLYEIECKMTIIFSLIMLEGGKNNMFSSNFEQIQRRRPGYKGNLSYINLNHKLNNNLKEIVIEDKQKIENEISNNFHERNNKLLELWNKKPDALYNSRVLTNSITDTEKKYYIKKNKLNKKKTQLVPNAEFKQKYIDRTTSNRKRRIQVMKIKKNLTKKKITKKVADKEINTIKNTINSTYRYYDIYGYHKLCSTDIDRGNRRQGLIKINL